MTRHEFVAIVEPLAQAMRTDIDRPTWSAYYRALDGVSVAIMAGVVDRLIQSPLTFFPKAGELRAECERQRRAVLALHPYDGCAECEHSRGFRQVLGTNGQMQVERCPCLSRHRERLERMGVAQPLAMLAGEADGENEQVYPTVQQLPAPLRKQLLEQVRQRVLR